jgi:hypothetical protein
MLRYGPELQATYHSLSEDDKEHWQLEADRSCTTGYDTNGSSVLSIFEAGYELAREATNNGYDTVFYLEDKETLPPTAYFFADNSEEAIRRRLLNR